MKEDPKKEINDIEKAMLHPKNAFAYNNYYNRGLPWYAKKEYTQVIKDFDEAIRLGPLIIVVFRLPWIERGKAWAAKGNYEKAIEDFDLAIWYCKNWPRPASDALQAQLNYERGKAWAHKG